MNNMTGVNDQKNGPFTVYSAVPVTPLFLPHYITCVDYWMFLYLLPFSLLINIPHAFIYTLYTYSHCTGTTLYLLRAFLFTCSCRLPCLLFDCFLFLCSLCMSVTLAYIDHVLFTFTIAFYLVLPVPSCHTFHIHYLLWPCCIKQIVHTFCHYLSLFRCSDLR